MLVVSLPSYSYASGPSTPLRGTWCPCYSTFALSGATVRQDARVMCPYMNIATRYVFSYMRKSLKLNAGMCDIMLSRDIHKRIPNDIASIAAPPLAPMYGKDWLA